MEVASYIYSADQSVSRGGDAARADGKDWYRNFEFEVQVRNVDLWNSGPVRSALSAVLGFLSDDQFSFRFRPLKHGNTDPPYFEFDENRPWFAADSVLMFSGGLDSLAGAIEEITNQGHSVALVSHRPVPVISSRQTKLVNAMSDSVASPKSLMHVPVWVNKDGKLTKDANQRTRSFLYASLGAATAIMHNLDSIEFYENVIISVNLPPAAQIKGSLASRSTTRRHSTSCQRFSVPYLIGNSRSRIRSSGKPNLILCK